MLIVIIAVNLLSIVYPIKEKPKAEEKTHKVISTEEMGAREQRMKELLENNRLLAVTFAVISFLSALILMAGLGLSIRCLALKLNGRDLMASYGSPPDVGWSFLDIFKVAIIFFFLGYSLQLIEAIFFRILGFKRADENVMIVFNSTIMDITLIGIVLYFVIKKYKSHILNLGVSFGNFLRNVRIAVLGYVTAIPVLLLVMVVVILILHLIRYNQTNAPVFGIFYESNRTALLLWLTVLVTLLGPVAEELFFRGFAYPVVKKRIGAKKAIILVSVVFSILHMNVVSFFPILLLGILLTYLYEKTGSLIPSIVVHIVHNSLVVSFVYLYRLMELPK